MVLDDRDVVAGDPDKAPQMLRQPADVSTALAPLADGDGVRQLRAAWGSLTALDSTAALPARLRGWVGRVTGRRNRYVLEAVVRATSEIADRCDELTTRLADQEALTGDLARTFGAELARLRAEVLHLQKAIDAPPGSTRSAH